MEREGEQFVKTLLACESRDLTIENQNKPADRSEGALNFGLGALRVAWKRIEALRKFRSNFFTRKVTSLPTHRLPVDVCRLN